MLVKSGYSKCWPKNYAYVMAVILILSQATSSLEETKNPEYDYLKISHVEKTALGRFRALVRPFLRNNFMKEDIYLIRWLRSQDLNIPNAKQMLLDNLRWRRANNIDTILKEDFSDMHEDYPYDFNARDKQGRPIGSLNVGSWNLRRAALTGRVPRLIRYMTKLLEMNTNNVVESIYQGNNVTEFKIIANLDGFNIVEHGCPLCTILTGMPVYTSFVQTIQGRYPGFTDKFIIVNTPPAFKAVLDTIQPIFTPRTRRAFKIFGKDKAQWMQYLEREISKNELDKMVALH